MFDKRDPVKKTPQKPRHARGHGRKTGRSIPISVMVQPSTRDALNELARQSGQSKTAIIESLIAAANSRAEVNA